MKEEEEILGSCVSECGVENDEICPILSSFWGVIKPCRKDCGIYSKVAQKCSIRALADNCFYGKRR